MSAPAVNLASSPLASDGLFRSALEACPDCVKILDLTGVVQFVNRNGVAIMGARNTAELLGRCWPALWDEPQRARATAALNAAAQGEVQRFAASGRVFTGDVRHFDNVLSPLRDDAGACVAVLVASRDVTELEQARLAAEARERKVAEQAAVLRSAAEMAKVAGWSVDYRTGVLIQSAEGLRILRGGQRVTPMQQGYEIYDPEDRDRIAAVMESARRTGQRISYEARITRYDGTRGWLRIHGEGVFEDGVCVGLRGVGMDISDEKAAQETLQRAEQRLLLAAQLAGMRVYEVDFAARTVTHHGWAPSLTQREPTFDDIWPLETNRLVDARDRDRVSAEWRQAVREGRPLRSEFRATRTDGQERWAYCVAELVRSADGQPQRVLAAIMDITERKRSEIETQRTLEHMREQEAHQKLLLGELNHRVKNTLASVQSVVQQTLRDTPDVGEARDLLLDRLMALSATHNLLVKTAWESASFRDLIEITLSPYGRPYAVTGPDLRLDPNFAISLGMALHELTMNALKHGAWKGSGRVDIDVEPRGDEAWILWRESGGPPVAPPTRRGFGSRLLERGVASEIHGQVQLDFQPDGLVCTIHAPLEPRLKVIR